MRRNVAVYCGWVQTEAGAWAVGYIGIGKVPERRWRAHERKAWGRYIVQWQIVEWYATRAQAKSVESLMIDQHRPLFNVAENEGHHHPLADMARRRRRVARAAEPRRRRGGWLSRALRWERSIRRWL